MLVKEIQKTDLNSIYYDVASASIKGAREFQQDSMISSFPIGQDFGFSIIADGMGGHASGEVASAMVAAELFIHLKMYSSDVETGSPNLPLILREGAERANKKLAAFVASDKTNKGMGTTLLAPVISGRQLTWISVGDSPFLLFRDGALRRLNKDHSMAPQIDAMIEVGSIDREKGLKHPERSVLTSAINGQDIEKIDCPASSIALVPGDILVASTDGLLTLSNAVLANTLAQNENASSDEITNTLLQALENEKDPKQDNVAITVIKIGENTRSSALEAEDMPVLAVANAPIVDKAEEVVPAPEVIAEPKPKKKTYFYRGQEYEKED